MKQFAIISLICIYAISTLGVSVKRFYCCGKLKNTQISFSQAIAAKCTSGSESDGCCQTEFQTYKVKDDHVVLDAISVPAKYFVDIDYILPILTSHEILYRIIPQSNSIHAPPIASNTPAYIFYCVYRI